MKIGLVLPGGGGKGAYQVGVMKALKEMGVSQYITSVSGTSIGALNALLFVQDDIKIAEKIWENISLEKIMPTDNFDLMKRGALLSIGNKNLNFIKKHMPSILNQGNLSRDGLLEIIDEYLQVNKIKTSKINCYATCTEVEGIKAKYFKYKDYVESDIKKILLATSALPAVYEAEQIDNKYYLDGGLIDNIPVQPLYGDGCDIIIVAHLSKEFPINRNDFPNSKIIEIFPSYMENGIMKGTLNFETDIIKGRISRGYEDTKNLLEPILELFLFKENEEKKSKYKWIDNFKNLFVSSE